MADYTQTVDFSAKDNLSAGDPAKKIKGSDVDGELAAISTAITSKAENGTNETITGDWTHSGDLTVSGTTTLSGPVTGLDWELVAATDISGSPEYVNFVSVFTDTYLVYKIFGTNIRCTRNLDQLYFQIGAGATPTWHTGTNYFYNSLYNSSNSTSTTGLGSQGNTTSYQALGLMLSGYSTGTAADHVGNFELTLYGTRGYSAGTPGMHTYEEAVGASPNASAIYITQTSNYIRSRTENTTSIRFTAGNSWSHTSAMTLEEGKIRIYGLRNA